jgi:hypothetical protein
MEQSSIQTREGEFVPGKPMYEGGCFGFNVELRKEYSPLVTVFVEDDGLWHRKETFDIHWIDDFLAQLTQIKKDYT